MKPGKLFSSAKIYLLAFILIASHRTATAAETNDTRMAWWSEARFGMFIHWDMSSVAGTEISWSRKGSKPLDIYGDPAGYVEDPAYDHLYEKFNPTNFNAQQWVKLAQAAGMKYIVFTAKHHGGFCMWDTQFTDYSIMHTPFHRDVVKELADACHAAGMRFGLYYSPRDWHQPDYGIGDNRKYVNYLNGQLRELLTHYGKIDILWFDSYGHGDPVDFWQIPETWALIHSLQPQVIINNRLKALRDKKNPVPTAHDNPPVSRGDFDTPEQKIGAFQNDRPWESCLSVVTAPKGGWSYRPDGTVKPLPQCIQTLVNCAAGDGNLLLDVGPDSLGQIPADQTDRLLEMGAWLKTNGPAIYGTRGSRLQASWGRVTQKGDLLYLHVFQWPNDGKLVVPGLKNKIISAAVLATGEKLKTLSDPKGITVLIPATAPDKNSSTIVVKFEAQIEDDVHSAPSSHN